MATPQRGRTLRTGSPTQKTHHIKIQSCSYLGSAFEVAAFKPWVKTRDQQRGLFGQEGTYLHAQWSGTGPSLGSRGWLGDTTTSKPPPDSSGGNRTNA